MGFRL